MSKTKLLSALADDLHRLADDINALLEAPSDELDEEVIVITEEESIVNTPPPPVKGEGNPAFIKLRATLRQLLERGGDAYGLICKYGATNIKEIEAEYYEAMQAEAEAMINGCK